MYVYVCSLHVCMYNDIFISLVNGVSVMPNVAQGQVLAI